MNLRFLLPALVLTLGTAPAPLVVGSVRDQQGSPIAGAVVTAGTLRTTTAADGTFALAGSATAVRISCSYCLAQTIPVRANDPVIAIVQRFQALSSSGPSTADIDALPYGRAESIVSLQPFVVLTDSRVPLPGPRLSDHGASPDGGVIIQDGIPNYDVVAGVSTLPSLPLFSLRQYSFSAPGQSVYPGDKVGGGIFSLSDLTAQGSVAIIAGGKDTSLDAAAAPSGALAYAAGASTNILGSSARASAQIHEPIGSDSVDLSLFAAHAGFSAGSIPDSDGSEGLRLGYQRARTNVLQATLVADRAGYDSALRTIPVHSRWSDIAGDFSLSSQTPIRLSAVAGFRLSTGNYDAFRLRIGGAVEQTHVDVSAQTSGDRYNVRAGLGAYSIGYTGGSTGMALPMHAQMIVPSLFASYDLSGRWNYALYAGSWFTLPNLLEAYGLNLSAGALPVAHYAQLTQTLTYTDQSRLKLALTMMNESVGNLDKGTLRGAGLSLAWQIAPLLALRGWTYAMNDASQTYEPLLRFGQRIRTATPGSAWLTYDNPWGIRVDAIYRADLLDALPDKHFDASISAPLADRLRWFVNTERRNGIRYVDGGVRFVGL